MGKMRAPQQKCYFFLISFSGAEKIVAKQSFFDVNRRAVHHFVELRGLKAHAQRWNELWNAVGKSNFIRISVAVFFIVSDVEWVLWKAYKLLLLLLLICLLLLLQLHLICFPFQFFPILRPNLFALFSLFPNLICETREKCALELAVLAAALKWLLIFFLRHFVPSLIGGS